MAFEHFLAMTWAEIEEASTLPASLAWMACRFSQDGPGLCDLPEALPAGSLLMLNDQLPFRDNDPQAILEQLRGTLERFSCRGLVVDFQRPEEAAQARLAELLYRRLPCPVCVTPEYAPSGCPVLLPPIAAYEAPETVLAPWNGREIWLETGLARAQIQLTPQGAAYSDWQGRTSLPFYDARLCCHYGIRIDQEQVRFFLARQAEDQKRLLKRLEGLGVHLGIGLYQEFSAQT